MEIKFSAGLFLCLEINTESCCAYHAAYLHSPVGGGCPMTIEEMRAVDVRTVDPETLVDVTQIVIPERLREKKEI